MPRPSALCLPLLLLTATPALAQEEFGGIDLAEPTVPMEFRPSIAFVGLQPLGPDGDAQGPRVRVLEPELLKVVMASTDFAKTLSPAQVTAALGPDDAAKARSCADYACLEALAQRLNVDRLVLGSVAKAGPGSLLTLLGFDSGLPEVASLQLDSGEKQEKALLGGFAGIQGKSQAQKDREFAKKAAPALFELLKKLNTPNGKLVVDCLENGAVSTGRGRELGKGSFEVVLPRGKLELEVTAEGCLPFRASVEVRPQQLSTVKVALVARPLEVKAAPTVPQAPRGTPFYARPGLYLAVAGLAAVVTGLVLGFNAKRLERRAGDITDGVADISAAQASTARTQALLANVLVASGGALTAGGAIWFALTPGVPKATRIDEAPSDAPPSGGGGGMTLTLGGSF